MKIHNLVRCISGYVCLSLIVAASGCGDLSSSVTGVVKLDGEVLKCNHNRRGTIVFRPVQGGASATGLIDENGKYFVRTGAADGVKPGEYHVGLRVLTIVPAEDGVSAPTGDAITPLLYSNPLTSGLITTLKSGANTFDIQLSSTAGPVRAPLTELPSEETPELGLETSEPTDDSNLSQIDSTQESSGQQEASENETNESAANAEESEANESSDPTDETDRSAA